MARADQPSFRFLRTGVLSLLAALVVIAAMPATGRSTAMPGHAAHSGEPTRGAGHGMFDVGSPSDPLITRMDGRLPFASSAGHAAAAPRVAATRTAAPAPTTLSRRCEKLIARKRSTLSRRERTRRRACVLERRRIAAAERKGKTPAPAAPVTPIAPGVTAPAPPVKGPDPVAAPPAVPTPTPVAGAPAPTPTPAPGSGAPSPVYAAVGVKAIDGGQKFELSRTFANADIVNFELVNTDKQQHDLWIAASNAKGEVAGAPVQIIGRIDGEMDSTPTRAATDMKLAPGRYVLICTVPGHGKMTVGFTVYAPPR